MTATERLRAMLDERGVEWWPSDDRQCEGIITHWRTGLIKWTAIEGEKDLWLNAGIAGHEPLTPEQAIEATLGRGECRDLAETPEYRDKTKFKCSECGYEYSAVGGFGCDCGDEPDFSYCPNCGRKVVDA